MGERNPKGDIRAIQEDVNALMGEIVASVQNSWSWEFKSKIIMLGNILRLHRKLEADVT